MLKKALKSLLTLGFMSLILFFSCKKESNLEPKDSLDVKLPNNPVGTLVFGVVTDENNKPIAGATVSLNSETTMTDQYGGFSGVGIAVTEKTVLKVNYNGYFQSIHVLELGNRKVHNVEIKLQKKKLVGSFDASSGATTKIDGGDSEASVAFPAGGYATLSGKPYNGNVNVYARFANIDSPNFIQTVPGTMTAVDNNGVLSNLRTFGMMEVLLTDDVGNPLQLKNSTATITVPIASSQSSTAPESIPLWYLDEKTAIWKQEGAAIKQGNNYVSRFTITYFYWCNYGISQPMSERAAIKGRTVVNINGAITPAKDIEVYTLGGSGFTGTDGTFGHDLPAYVASGIPLDVLFRKWHTYCFGSELNRTVSIPALAPQQVYDMGDIDVTKQVYGAKTIAGKVYLCNNTPTDDQTYVRLYGDNDVFIGAVFTNAQGQFSFLTCISITKILITTTSGQQKIITDITSENLTNIILECPTTPYDNEFTINGDGFDNYRVVDIAPELPVVRDSAAHGINYYVYSSYANPVVYKLIFKSSGDSWGEVMGNFGYDLWDITGYSFYINPSVSGVQYKPISGTTVITSNTATEIQGTYSGVVQNTQTNQTATISNGRFRIRKS